jgi:hypothetical protein
MFFPVTLILQPVPGQYFYEPISSQDSLTFTSLKSTTLLLSSYWKLEGKNVHAE